MFDHLEFSVASIARSRVFYRSVSEAVGGREIFFDESDRACGFGLADVVQLLITEGPPTTPHLHICFQASSKNQVKAAYQAALANGGGANGDPGYREHYCEGYYAAFFFDPDGHNVEALFREPTRAR